MDTSYRLKASQQICSRLSHLEPYRKATRIGLYQATNGEVDLSDIWSTAPFQGKFCYFPAITKESTLIFLPATPKTPFKKNKYGIDEPDVSHDLAVQADELDLILMPLVAFDFRCRRLGMGSGYYDRTLKTKKNCLLFGVAYQYQRVDFIEQEPWDIPMDAVITQKAVYWREAQI